MLELILESIHKNWTKFFYISMSFERFVDQLYFRFNINFSWNFHIYSNQ